jgi:hypothetical protein
MYRRVYNNTFIELSVIPRERALSEAIYMLLDRVAPVALIKSDGSIKSTLHEWFPC